MKIGIIIGALGFGGAERVTITLSEYWTTKGHEVNIFTTMKKANKEYECPKGVHRIECNADNKLLTIEKLRKQLRYKRQDVVLIMDTPMCVVAIPALIGQKIPYVVSERSSPTTKAVKRITKAVSHILMNLAYGYVFQTNGAKGYYNKRVQRKSIVIPNPLKTENLPLPYKDARDERVVAVGRLISAKDYPNLIKAFVNVHAVYNNYILEIYGDGELHKELYQLINDIKAEEYIRLMGASNNVLNDINSASVYVLSSNIEGMPNALIEAMALGLPCVSTDCPSGGPRDLIIDKINGLLVPVNDSNRLSDAIISLISDKTLAQNISTEAVSIRNLLNVSKIGDIWINYFEQIISGRI